MQNPIVVLIFFYSSCFQISSQHSFDKELNLIPVNFVKQLETVEKQRFDLSGLVKFKDGIYVIADKEWNNHIYRIDTNATTFKALPVIELNFDDKIDLEGIDVCNDKFYLIEEWYNEVYTVNLSSGKTEKLEISWQEHNIDRKNWGNRGFEGIACDCANNVLYLAKERQPRKIFKVDLNGTTISEPFADFINSEEQGFDIADMKFENGALYLLERGKGLVTKIDVKTNAKYSVSFQHIVFKDNQRLFKNKNPEYGMAEALLLTENEIWIGLDNSI